MSVPVGDAVAIRVTWPIARRRARIRNNIVRTELAIWRRRRGGGNHLTDGILTRFILQLGTTLKSHRRFINNCVCRNSKSSEVQSAILMVHPHGFPFGMLLLLLFLGCCFFFLHPCAFRDVYNSVETTLFQGRCLATCFIHCWIDPDHALPRAMAGAGDKLVVREMPSLERNVSIQFE